MMVRAEQLVACGLNGRTEVNSYISTRRAKHATNGLLHSVKKYYHHGVSSSVMLSHFINVKTPFSHLNFVDWQANQNVYDAGHGCISV